jgi:hypothetical protein
MRAFLSGILILMSCCGPALGQSVTEARFLLADLRQWLPGDYDNEPQIFLETGLGLPVDEAHPRLALQMREVGRPDIGADVYLLQMREGGLRGKIVRQRILSFSIDETRRAVAMTTYGVDADDEPEDLTSETTDQAAWTIKPLGWGDNCPFLWRREVSVLRGAYENGTCRMTASADDRPMDLRSVMTLGPEELLALEEGFHPDGSRRFGRVDQVPNRFFKTRRFECFLVSQENGQEPDLWNPVFLHDRGDSTDLRPKLRADGVQPPTWRMRLRRSLWPSRSGRNFTELLSLDLFQLAADGSQDEAGHSAGGWAEGSSARVGFAFPGGSGRCKLAHLES